MLKDLNKQPLDNLSNDFFLFIIIVIIESTLYAKVIKNYDEEQSTSNNKVIEIKYP